MTKEEETSSCIRSITSKIIQLQKELELSKPQHERITLQLNNSATKPNNLYLLSSSLDQEQATLKSQKLGFDHDLKVGLNEMVQANTSWDQMRNLLKQASK